jgi:3-deoxy-D-manno-octulosonic-acid transferase
MPETQELASALPTRVPWCPEPLRWLCFRLLENLSEWRRRSTKGQLSLDTSKPAGPALWIYVSTIGELNAVAPVLDWLIKQHPGLIPVLISDHEHYREAYQARYPQARICISHGYSGDAAQLADHHPPALLVIAEIPCLPSDAPCRFSYAFVRKARTSGATLLLLNGWLYHYETSARLDALERQLFQSDYLRSFHALCVQDEATRAHLAARGAPEDRLYVTGNIKFDSMLRPHWSPEQARSPALLKALMQSGRPVVVAGCVSHAAEQEQVLQAFTWLRSSHPDALLILAPRHPENAPSMQALAEVLSRFDLRVCMRTDRNDEALPDDCHCLILNTVGELRDFYAVASASHVGVDHNVLEPLGFGKAVSVMGDWNATYPSYPVYCLLRDQGALHEAREAAHLVEFWNEAIRDTPAIKAKLQGIERVLRQARGAVARHSHAIETVLRGRA